MTVKGHVDHIGLGISAGNREGYVDISDKRSGAL